MGFDSKGDLVKRIEAEFPATRWEGTDWPFTVRSIDTGWMTSRIRGKTWKDLNAADLRFLHSGVCMLKPSAHAQFLPAFMRSALVDYDAVDIVAEAIAWSYLAHGQNGSGWRSITLLNAEQREIVFDYLDWYLSFEREELRAIEVDDELPGCLARCSRKLFEKQRVEHEAMVTALSDLRAAYSAK